jgi:biopolymer transport protein ExbB
MFLLQITENADMVQQSVQTTQESLNLFSLIMKGGWVMIPIIALSVLGVYIFIERYLTIKRASRVEPMLLAQVRENVLNGNINAATIICKQSESPIGKMLLKGLTRIGKPIKEIEGAIENIGKVEVSKLEKNISILGIIAGTAPMFGFLGTISGVIRIFYNISLSDNISIGIIAGGLYEKMITSAAGLFIGILAYVGHHILNMMVDKLILRMETDAIDFIDLLEQPSR